MLVDSGQPTTASYISGTAPLPHNKPGIAAATAMAGEQLGLRLMYLDGGSGAQQPVAAAMISAVREAVSVPLIVGGGLNTGEKIRTALGAGADLVVVGNHLERNPGFLAEAVAAVRQAS
jgi:putative glycerol-1-phosphate prenyltransferase